MNYKNIPIVINNFNRLTTLRGMITDLNRLGYTNLHILDNASTYQPLVEYYQQIEVQGVNLRRLDRNYVMYALWDCGILNDFTDDYIVYSDSDLVLNPNLPENFLETLIGYLERYNVKKAGFALKIDDLPNTLWGNKNMTWEAKYWSKELEKDVYEANIDTTFFVMRRGTGVCFEGVRVAGNFTASHQPWYIDWDNLSEEDQYYHATAHGYSTSKRFYDEYKTK